MSLVKARDIFFCYFYFMDFGTVAPELIREVDFTLAPDTELTRNVLKTVDATNNPDIYVGCAK